MQYVNYERLCDLLQSASAAQPNVKNAKNLPDSKSMTIKINDGN